MSDEGKNYRSAKAYQRARRNADRELRETYASEYTEMLEDYLAQEPDYEPSRNRPFLVGSTS